MKPYELFSLIRRFLMPVLLTVLGAILILSPDTASALISRCVGYGLIAGAVISGISAIASPRGRFGKSACAIVLAIAGGWLTAHPLFLVAWISRFLGVLMLADGIVDLLYARSHGRGALMPAIGAGIGAILLLMPMAASRLVFILVGLVVLVMGVLMLIDRIREWRLPPGGDPNIIDAL